MKRISVILMVLVIAFVVMELVIPQGAHAAAGGTGKEDYDAVITAEKLPPWKIWFGAGMLVAGVLAVKYL